MAEGYYEQLLQHLQSGEPEAVYETPDTGDVRLQIIELPDRPDIWPEGLPEPVLVQSAHADGVAFIRNVDREPLILMRSGDDIIAIPYEDIDRVARDMFQGVLAEFKDLPTGYDQYLGINVPAGRSDSLVTVVGGELDGEVRRIVTLDDDGLVASFGRTEIGDMRVEYLIDPDINLGMSAGDAARIDEVGLQSLNFHRHSTLDVPELGAFYDMHSQYLQDIDPQEGVVFGQNMSVADISADGAVEVSMGEFFARLPMEHYLSEVSPDAENQINATTETLPDYAEDDFGDVMAVLPEQELTNEDTDLSVGERFIRDEIGLPTDHIEVMGGIGKTEEMQFPIILHRIENAFASDPQLEDEDVRSDISSWFNHKHGVADPLKAVVAAYIEERYQLGETPNMNKYHAAVHALREDDVDRAKHMIGVEEDAVPEVNHDSGMSLDLK